MFFPSCPQFRSKPAFQYLGYQINCIFSKKIKFEIFSCLFQLETRIQGKTPPDMENFESGQVGSSAASVRGHQ